MPLVRGSNQFGVERWITKHFRTYVMERNQMLGWQEMPHWWHQCFSQGLKVHLKVIENF